MEARDMTMIRIPYVKEYVDKAGTVRRYFRKRGCKAVALPGVPGSSEFMAAYQAAMGTPLERPARQGPGTVAALIVDYLRGPAFANLKPSSQTVYRIVLDRFGTKHGHRLVRDMPRDKVAAYVHAIGAARPAMANLTRAVLQRIGDVARMRRNDIAGGCIAVVQQKTGTALSIPMHPTLTEAMRAGPNNSLHLIGDPNGRPMTGHALSAMMVRAIKAAKLPDECVPHGLRKAMARRLAESGSTAKEIASISGHKSLHEVERYTAQADQKKLSRAAMDKLRTDDGV